MGFARVFSTFTKWFYILGQSNALPPDQLLTTSARSYFQRVNANPIYKYIPVTVFLLIAISMTAVVFWSILTDSVESRFGKIINAQSAIVLLIVAVTILIVAGQTMLQSSYFSQLFAQLNVIEHLFRPHVACDLLALRHLLIRRMICVFIGLTLPYIATMLSKPTINFTALGCDFILKSLPLASYLQVLFYIELLDHLLGSLVKYIEMRAIATTTINMTTLHSRAVDTKFISEMYYFKLLHFNLWEFARIINNLFGWCLMFSVLYYFVYIVFKCYHVSVTLLYPLNIPKILRELTVTDFTDLSS